VISDRLWRTRYAADPGVIGRGVQLNGRLQTIVGVLPAGFNFPAGIDVYQRLNWDLSQHTRAAHFMEAVARLRPGASVEQANRELHALAGRLEREYAATNQGWTINAVLLHHEVIGFFRPALYALVGAVSLLLLVACINVANLLLARATVREREVALRAAIGATRSRLVRQLLTESVLLAAVGAVVGVACAAAGVGLLLRFAPIDIPRLDQVTLNVHALGFAVMATIGTVVLFGLMPAAFLARTDLQSALKTGTHGSTGGARGQARRLLVVAEVGLAVMLLVAAGLLVRSVQRLVREDPGFVASGVLTASVELPATAYQDWPGVARFYGALSVALRQHPAVTGASATNVLPLSPGWRIPFQVEGRPRPREGEAAMVQHHSVDEAYFQTIGVPLVGGRWFEERDSADSHGVVLINETLAKAYWPGEHPVGRMIVSYARAIGPLGRSLIRDSRYEIVGVVADVKNASLQNATEPAIFYTQRQFPFRNMHLVARGRGSAESLTAVVRDVVRRLDPALPLSGVTTLDRVIGDTIDRPRMLTTVMSIFALLALSLAALGIYGVLSYAVNQRRQELSVRMALGAEPRAIVWLVVRQGLTLAAGGIAAGAAGGYMLGRLLSGLLYGVTPTDAATFAIVIAAVAAVAVAACVLPARRAAATDLLDALRGE
jgi:predicted permease